MAQVTPDTRDRASASSCEIIVTHEHADFDAVASMLAAQKLYPAAIPILPRHLNRNVQGFLRLYRDALPFVRPEEWTRTRVQRVIVVDSQSFQPPRGVTPTTPVLVIDHHPPRADLPAHWTFMGEPLGATTTWLVEQLAQRHLPLTPIEATLLMLGIYEDTGSLLYSRTTPRDLRAAAWLLERGASLDVVERFLHHPLSEEQQALFRRLLTAAEVLDIHGHTVVIAAVAAPDMVDELSTLAHKLQEVYDPSALVLLIGQDHRVQLIARSQTDAIDVAAIASALGGGGHPRAAAALIHEGDLTTLKEHVVRLLKQHTRPPLRVADIMSHSVRTVPPDMPARDVDADMRRFGFEGYPVVDPQTGRLLGLVTRRQVDRALHHGLGDAPVHRIMHVGEYTVRPEDSVERVQEIMMRSGWGQIPVVDAQGRIIGIVTRTDLIKLWGHPSDVDRRAEIAQRLEAALPPALLTLLRLVSQEAATLGMPLYAVGGFVRDLLLGVRNWDVDLVVEGDAIALAQHLARKYGGRVRSHRRFGTAKWILPTEDVIVQGEGLPTSLDLVTARTEFYEHPTALPTVERSSIKQDLHRRDFTINTLAIRLDGDHWGELLDFYGGLEDLQRGLIRVLHSLSFVEDPTRILRAVRFEQRFGFRIEPRTEELIADARDLLARVSGPRIAHELFLIFQEAEPERALQRLHDLGVLPYIHPALTYSEQVATRFRRLREARDRHPPSTDVPILYWALWLYDLPSSDLRAVSERLQFNRETRRVLEDTHALREHRELLRAPTTRPSQVVRLMDKRHPAAFWVVAVAEDDTRIWERYTAYMQRWRHVKPTIDGTYLREVVGLKPGPLYGRILRRLRDAWLDGDIHSPDEEKAYLERLLQEEKLTPAITSSRHTRRLPR